MNTNPRNNGSVNAEPLAVDPTGQDPAATDPAADAKLRLQLAIFEVTKDARGKGLDEILDRLRAAFAAQGVRTPPTTWLESVASSVFYGEPYIIDLPAAVAADAAVPAPSRLVRDQIASRRELREEKLPPGTFPSPADWQVPATEITRTGTAGREHQVRVSRPAGGNRAVLAAVSLAAAVVVSVLAVRGRRRRQVPVQAHTDTTRKCSNV
ncbi:hypothetical protein [Arthrobacter sp. OAP107]|uniref:hypothetical protein n=1 Tax=Arthrobacter sp. OAP107 TaxID=3156445 RepID=UPI003390D49F